VEVFKLFSLLLKTVISKLSESFQVKIIYAFCLSAHCDKQKESAFEDFIKISIECE